MVRVSVGNNIHMNAPTTVPGETTIRELLESSDQNCSSGTIHVDGAPIGPGDLDRSLDELGITDPSKTHFVLAITKSKDN